MLYSAIYVFIKHKIKFMEQIDKACARDSEKLNSCKNRYPSKENAGHFMSCLIDEKISGELKPACEDFLTQVITSVSFIKAYSIVLFMTPNNINSYFLSD